MLANFQDPKLLQELQQVVTTDLTLKIWEKATETAQNTTYGMQ